MVKDVTEVDERLDASPPALHVHPATDTLLHYISPEIEWVVVGIDERWRDGVRAVFRKRPRPMERKREDS